MTSHLRAVAALDRVLEPGTPVERGIVHATALLEVAGIERLYHLRQAEDAELRGLLHAAADRAMEAWVGAFVVALERFEAAHPNLPLREAPAVEP
jgi:hypothetical protein